MILETKSLPQKYATICETSFHPPHLQNLSYFPRYRTLSWSTTPTWDACIEPRLSTCGHPISSRWCNKDLAIPRKNSPTAADLHNWMEARRFDSNHYSQRRRRTEELDYPPSPWHNQIDGGRQRIERRGGVLVIKILLSDKNNISDSVGIGGSSLELATGHWCKWYKVGLLATCKMGTET